LINLLYNKGFFFFLLLAAPSNYYLGQFLFNFKLKNSNFMIKEKSHNNKGL